MDDEKRIQQSVVGEYLRKQEIAETDYRDVVKLIALINGASSTTAACRFTWDTA